MECIIPCFAVIGGSAILGIVNYEWLTAVANGVFSWSLSTFGWLYQIVAMVTLFLAAMLTFTKVGKIRFGGPEAKAKYSFGSWFAMTLTGGIATGLITYGVNEVLIYYGNIYGELDALGIEPLPSGGASITGPSFLMPCMRCPGCSLPICTLTGRKSCPSLPP